MDVEELYISDNEYFEKIMKLLNQEFLIEYSSDNLCFLKDLFEKTSLYNKKLLMGKKINKNEFMPLFLEMIKSLNNKDLYEYYKFRIQEIPLLIDRSLKKGNAYLDDCFIEDDVVINGIYLAKNNSMSVDLASYSHELGHVAYYDNKPKDRKDYYEYFEVLPILLEYFTFVFLNGKDGKELFYRERLFLEKSASLAGIRSINLLNQDLSDVNRNKFFIHDIADSFKYLASSNFVFNCIDLLDSDRNYMINLISNTLLGKMTVKELENIVGIKDDNCKRLVMEYERRK